MITGKFNVVTDGQWGSCGKGLITTALAYLHKPKYISTTNMANAGHTAVDVDGKSFVAKAVPSAAILNKWCKEYNPYVIIGPSAAFDIAQMQKEISECSIEDSIFIHQRAGVITQTHKDIENGTSGTKHIASTMQGCGAFLAEKIMRRSDLKLASQYEELKPYTDINKFARQAVMNTYKSDDEITTAFTILLTKEMTYGKTVIHEGSQGFSLDINHGSHYPQCTSRGTTAVQNMADMGISPKKFGDVYLVIRPYPIRVGNVVENGKTVGYSGDCYFDQREMTWAEVANAAGAPPEVMSGELTTVTKRLRRVFTFSDQQILEATVVNGATRIALNFANYIDWSCYGINDATKLPEKVMKFIDHLEELTNIPVSIVGTGPRINHVCFR